MSSHGVLTIYFRTGVSQKQIYKYKQDVTNDEKRSFCNAWSITEWSFHRKLYVHNVTWQAHIGDVRIIQLLYSRQSEHRHIVDARRRENNVGVVGEAIHVSVKHDVLQVRVILHENKYFHCH